MKIAQVCPRYYPYMGGVETHVREISEKLVKKGYEVEVLTTDPSRKLPKEEVINGVRIKRFNSWAPNEAYYFSRSLKRYLMKNSGQYDIVHAHSYHALPALYAAQAKKGNKFVFTPHYHGGGHTFFRNLLHIFYKPVGREIFNKANCVICVSKYEKKLILKNFKINEKKIILIPNGINLSELKTLKRKRDYNNRTTKTILYVGRLERYKGVDNLIRVLPMLGENFCLKIVGKGPYKRALVKLAKKLGVANRTRFYQNLSREELLQKYTEASVFVMLSKHEAYCISVAEALALGVPCIVTNMSALREYVDNERCFGIDYPVNINKLASLIIKVSEKKISSNSLNLISWDIVVRELIKVYMK